MTLPRIFTPLFHPLNRSRRKDETTSEVSTVQSELPKSESDYDDYIAPSDCTGFGCNEDQHVAMLPNVVQKTSARSLPFLSQNRAQSVSNISGMQLECAPKRRSRNCNRNLPVQQKFTIKKLRFAEINGGRVLAVVHEIPLVRSQDKAHVWWSVEELADTAYKARKCVRRFVKICPKHEESIRVLAGSYGSPHDLDKHIEKMSKNGHVLRGFESRICSIFEASREQSIRAVLREQEKQRYQKHLKNSLKQQLKVVKVLQKPKVVKLWHQLSERTLGDTTCTTMSSSSSDDVDFVFGSNTTESSAVEYDESSWNRIRECYQGVGTPCRTYAFRIAECDRLQAIRAFVAPWK